MTSLTFGKDWKLEVGVQGDGVVLYVSTPSRNGKNGEGPIPFVMWPVGARKLGVALVACARAIDPKSAEHARLIAEAEADIEAMLNGTDHPMPGVAESRKTTPGQDT